MNLEFGRIYIDTDETPAVIERYAGSMYLYRYDLKLEEPVETESEDDTPKSRYSFVEVRLKGYPNRNETIKCLLRKLVTLEDELKLINDFNEAVENDELNSDDYTNYKKYLEFRKEIKRKVRTDFDNEGY